MHASHSLLLLLRLVIFHPLIHGRQNHLLLLPFHRSSILMLLLFRHHLRRQCRLGHRHISATSSYLPTVLMLLQLLKLLLLSTQMVLLLFLVQLLLLLVVKHMQLLLLGFVLDDATAILGAEILRELVEPPVSQLVHGQLQPDRLHG